MFGFRSGSALCSIEGSGNEQDAVAEGLQVHDALAAETSSKDDEDGTGLERSAELGGADGLADL